MTPQPEILTGLGEIINKIAGTDPSTVRPEQSFTKDLNIDSLSMIEIVYDCEDKFGVEIPDSAIRDLVTVGDAVSYIQTAQG